MGWSHREEAGRVERAWSEGCRRQTGSGNAFRTDRGVRYFYEVTRRDQPGGGIGGTVFRVLPGGLAVRAGRFRIEGDGTIARAPAKLKAFAAAVTAELEAARGRPYGTGPFVTKVAR